MSLDNDMLCHAIDLDVLVLLVQEDSQLVPQGRYVAGDLPYCRQMQVAASLIVGIDGQVLVRRSRDGVFGRW